MSEKVYVEDNEFIGIDYTEDFLKTGNYENCIFENCNFSNNDLSESIFIDCEFDNCIFSMIKNENTSFRNCNFKNSKVLGVQFDECKTLMLSMEFDGCQLNYSSFYSLDLSGKTFNNCEMHEVDFGGCDLSKSIFLNCDLRGSNFENTKLYASDLRSAVNYSIDPEKNDIRKAKFSLIGISGLLEKYDIEIE